MKIITIAVLITLVLTLGASAEPTSPAKGDAAKVTVTADGTKVTEVLQSIANQAKEKVVIESYVKGNVTLSLNDKTFEDALSTVCKSCKLDWRKVYIAKGDKILEQPDRLAATVRLVTSMTYPDLVVAGASSNKLGIFAREQKAISKLDDKIAGELGLSCVYLVTDDAKVAAAIAKKDKEKKADESINSYLQKSKEQMEAFMKMTPEQQEQAMMEGLNMLDQFPADYTAVAMRAMMSMDPELMRQKLAKQSRAHFDAMFAMPTEQRRAFWRMQMQMGASAMGALTPEQQQMLQDDIKAIQAETGGGN